MKLKHPDSKQVLDVRDEDVDTYRSQGWSESGKAEETTPQIVVDKK